MNKDAEKTQPPVSEFDLTVDADQYDKTDGHEGRLFGSLARNLDAILEYNDTLGLVERINVEAKELRDSIVSYDFEQAQSNIDQINTLLQSLEAMSADTDNKH